MESPRLHVQTGGILYQKTGGGDDDADHDALRRYPMRHLEWHGTDAARPADTLCDMHLYNQVHGNEKGGQKDGGSEEE